MTDKNKDKKAKLDVTTETAQDMFTNILQSRLQSGALEQAIEKRVDLLINETADDVFRSYGELGKALKEKLTKSILPGLESLDDFPLYHDFVIKRLKHAAGEFYDARLSEVLDAEIKDIMGQLPETATLSFILDLVSKDSSNDDEDGSCGNISLIIDSGISGFMVYIDEDEDASKSDCKYKLHLMKNKETGGYRILSLKVDGESKSKFSTGRLYNTEKILFNMFAMKKEIILDSGIGADDYTTYYDFD